MQFMSRAEGQSHRAEHGFRKGMEFLERGDLQRAWLAGCVVARYVPERPEGHLLLARVDARKALVLNERAWLLDVLANYRKVLAIDPAHAEALAETARIGKMGIGPSDVLALQNRLLGTDPVAFKLCQTGYHPDGVKSAVIWTLDDYSSGKFQVIDALTGVVELEDDLEKKGVYAWKRNHWVAEFSSVSRPADYCVKVSFENGPAATSHAFPVRKDVYEKCMRLSLTGFFNHRCGQDLPWRKGCNDGPLRFSDVKGDYLGSMEDGLAELPAPVDLRGGWHDGGNWERHSTNMITNLFCLLLGHQYAPRDWHLYGESVPDVLVEARYAADYYLNCMDKLNSADVSTHVHGAEQAPDGRYFLTRLYLSHKDRNRIHFVTTGKSRGRRSWVPWFTRLFAPSLAFMALQYESYDAAYAGRCKRRAMELQDYYREPEKDETLSPSTIAAIALGDMYLFRLTGKARYMESARDAMRRLLALHDPDGFFPYEGIEEKCLCLAGFFPQIALCEFARLFPDDPLRKKIAAAMEKFMGWIEKLSSMSPFRHMMEMKKENPVNLLRNNINGHGQNAYFGYAAIVCLLADRVLGTKRYRPIAERQVEWIFGRNPNGICTMGEAGYRNGSQHLADVFDHGLEFKQVPGFVSLGIIGKKIEGFGEDYPFFPTHDVDGAGQGHSIHWSTCEGGGMTEGPIHAALALLAGAMEQSRKPSKRNKG